MCPIRALIGGVCVHVCVCVWGGGGGGVFSSILRTGEMFFRHDICTALLTQVFEGESGSGTSETWYHWKAHEME